MYEHMSNSNKKKNIIPGYLHSSRVNLIGPHRHSDQGNDIKGFGRKYAHLKTHKCYLEA